MRGADAVDTARDRKIAAHTRWPVPLDQARSVNCLRSLANGHLVIRILDQFSCSEASCHSSGCKSRQQRSPVDAVVISSNGKGDRSIGSLDVKVPDGQETGRIRSGGRATRQAVAMCQPLKPRKDQARVKRICGSFGSAELLRIRRRPMSTSLHWNLWVFELPGVVEDGMPGRNGQRKPGTARGSPRRSRTAKAARISRRAVKSCCACERDGWGRLSDDGSRQYNSNRSEDPWGRWSHPPHGGVSSSPQARL